MTVLWTLLEQSESHATSQLEFHQQQKEHLTTSTMGSVSMFSSFK